MSAKNNMDNLFKSKLYSRDFAFDEEAWSDMEKILDEREKKPGRYWNDALYGWIALFLISTAGYFGTSFQGKEEPWLEGVKLSAVMEKGAERSADLPQYTDPNSNRTQKRLSDKAPLRNNTRAVLDESTEFNISGTNKDAKNERDLLEKSRIPDKPLSRGEEVVMLNETSPKVISKERPGKSKKNGVFMPGPSSGSMASNAPSNRISGDVSLNSTGSPEKNRDHVFAARTTESMYVNEIGAGDLKYMQPLLPELETNYEKDIIKGKTALLTKRRGPGGKRLLRKWGLIAGYGFGNHLQDREDGATGLTNAYFAGLRYAHSFNSSFSIQSNAIVRQIRNVNSEIIFNSSEFGFGFQEQTTVIESKKLTYLALPVYLNYNISGMHNVYGGIQYAYLMGVLSDKTIITENSFESTTNVKRDQEGYKDHFRSLHVSLLMGYEYMLSERFALGLRYHIGVNSIPNDEYVRTTGRQHEWKATLNFNLIK